MEQTEKVEGVHKANGTNGNTARVCILYQTRVLCHKGSETSVSELFCVLKRGFSFDTRYFENVKSPEK